MLTGCTSFKIIAAFLLISQVLCQSAAWAGPMTPPTIIAPGQSSGTGATSAPSEPSGGAGSSTDSDKPLSNIKSGEQTVAAGAGTSELRRSRAEPLDFKISPDGTVATILFDRESVQAMRDLSRSSNRPAPSARSGVSFTPPAASLPCSSSWEKRRNCIKNCSS